MTEANLSAYFQGGLVPTWLADFTREPEQAVGALLAGAMPLDHLAAAEPSLSLLDWIEMLAEDSDFPRALDEALASWINAQWGDSLAVGHSASLTAVAWTRVCEIIAYGPQLTDAGTQLRRRVSDDRTFLRDLSEGRSRDPEGLAWFALGRTQTNDRLLQDWWRLCNLDPGVPWYHGYYGVSGLAGLPEGTRKEELLQVCGNGLARLALALARRVDEGWLQEHIAREEFHRTARLFMHSVPFPERWQNFWGQALQNREFEEVPAESWVQGLFSGELPPPSRSSDGQRNRFLPDPDWPHRARDIRRKLSAGDDTTLKTAEDFLAEQRAYGERTGDWIFFVKSACNFATTVRRDEPTRAAEWAVAALRSEPSNPYTWTTLAQSLVQLHRWRDAENIYLEATERFPNNAVTYTGLAETLRARNKLEEAEAVYRDAHERFPNDAVTYNGLAETLRARNKLEEAEAVYRDAHERFPNNTVTYTGLAETLRARNKLEEAEAVYRDAHERFPNNAVTYTGLAETLRARNKLEEAEAVYREAHERFPNDAVTYTGLAETLRARNKLEEAEAVYRDAHERFPNNEFTYTGLAETLRARNKLEQAEAVYREAHERFPNNAVTYNGLAETLRAGNKLEEAEAVYREACERFPGSFYARTGLERVRSLLAGIAPPVEKEPSQRSSGAEEKGETPVDEVVDDTPPPYRAQDSFDAEQASSATVRQEDFEFTVPEPPGSVGRDQGFGDHDPDTSTTVERKEVESTVSEVAGSVGRDQGFRDHDLDILLSEASFVRRLGRLVGWSDEGQGSRIIRERARDLLGRIPGDAQRLGSEESANVALMRLDEDELDEALLLLREAVKRFPGNVRVQYALARAQREAAELERKRLDLESVAQIVRPWRRLRGLDQRTTPVSWLGEARVLFAYVDGASIEEGARDVLGKLARWTSQQQLQEEREDSGRKPTSKTQAKSLAEWWSGQVRSHLFPSNVMSAADIADVGPLRSALHERSKLFDSLEESWVRSVSATTLPPNLPGS